MRLHLIGAQVNTFHFTKTRLQSLCTLVIQTSAHDQPMDNGCYPFFEKQAHFTAYQTW